MCSRRCTRRETLAEAEAAIELFRIAPYRDARASTLPQGVRKLLDIAMAVMGAPRVLLLDEPTSGISVEEKFGLMDVVMSALKSRRITVLFVEHDMEIVARFADRVLAFYDGTVIADGTPDARSPTRGCRPDQRHHARPRRRGATMLRVANLDVAIGPVPIIRDASLALDEGEMCGLIGRNGAGKTTLLRALMGAIPATGKAELDAVDLLALPAHGRVGHGIGYMPEDRRLVPDFTVEENILLPTWTTDDRRQAAAAEMDLLDHAGGRGVPRAGARSNCPAASRRWWRSRAR